MAGTRLASIPYKECFNVCSFEGGAVVSMERGKDSTQAVLGSSNKVSGAYVGQACLKDSSPQNAPSWSQQETGCETKCSWAHLLFIFISPVF